jgi:hypothetical protein
MHYSVLPEIWLVALLTNVKYLKILHSIVEVHDSNYYISELLEWSELDLMVKITIFRMFILKITSQ